MTPSDIGQAIRDAWRSAPNTETRRVLLGEITLALSGVDGTNEDPDPGGHRDHALALVTFLRSQLDEHTLRGGAPWAAGVPARSAPGSVSYLVGLAINLNTVLVQWRTALQGGAR